jgi:hypothetical protein
MLHTGGEESNIQCIIVYDFMSSCETTTIGSNFVLGGGGGGGITGFKIKISSFEIFVGFFVYVIFLPAVFIFDNESVSVRR